MFNENTGYLDYSKYSIGDVVTVHCCDRCVRRAGLTPKYPPDEDGLHMMCYLCGHYGVGSTIKCELGSWLILRPVRATVVEEAN